VRELCRSRADMVQDRTRRATGWGSSCWATGACGGAGRPGPTPTSGWLRSQRPATPTYGPSWSSRPDRGQHRPLVGRAIASKASARPSSPERLRPSSPSGRVSTLAAHQHTNSIVARPSPEARRVPVGRDDRLACDWFTGSGWVEELTTTPPGKTAAVPSRSISGSGLWGPVPVVAEPRQDAAWQAGHFSPAHRDEFDVAGRQPPE
jgi:hypothetical protein